MLDQPTLSCTWKPQDATTIFDIHPTANWDSTNAALDTQANDNVIATTTDTQICTELWKLTATSVACVEMGGSVSRKFDTSDTTSDFPLEYTTYKMHAKFGNVDDVDTVWKFNELDVNFADLLASETAFAHWGYQAAGLSALGSLFAMLG